MTRLSLALIAAAMVLPVAGGAQEVRIAQRPDAVSLMRFTDDRPMIGVTLSGDADRADTLGILVSDVTKDSPAEKAGLKSGDRIQAINGVNLRAAKEDAGDEDYAGILVRRLTRELGKVKEGESVELRVLSGTQARTVRVTPVKGSELAKAREMEAFGALRSRVADRPVLGLSIMSTGSARDTIGVFVQSVTPGGPAEKAGIIEGDRIASINGVSVKVAREDAEDHAVGAARHMRLQREIQKLKAGDAAELVVVTAGRSRTVRVTAVKASELPESERSAFFFGQPGAMEFKVPMEMELRAGEMMLPRMEEMKRRMEVEVQAKSRARPLVIERTKVQRIVRI